MRPYNFQFGNIFYLAIGKTRIQPFAGSIHPLRATQLDKLLCLITKFLSIKPTSQNRM